LGGYVAALEKGVGMAQDCVIDAEAIGGVFHCFDLLESFGISFKGISYGERYESLTKLFADGVLGGCMKLVPMAVGVKAKRAMFDRLKKKEGVVFKRLNSVYTSGKGHGDMVKAKFRSEASCIVAPGREGKSSIGLELLDQSGGRVFVGNCTISGKGVKLPGVGEVCEIRYLYAYKGGSLYQPVYKGPRTDVDVSECLVSQLKYKSEED
jgi:bifunctional non-homologous end joining protein LigD